MKIDIEALPGTDFQRAVWRGLTTIPPGETITYAGLAQRIGRPTAVRAVANAVGKNPMAPEIPCHRVVAKNGIGGYSGPGGVAAKIRLLRAEGVRV